MSENILPEVREWCDQRVAEAVRAEREECARIVTRYAGHKLRMLNLPWTTDDRVRERLEAERYVLQMAAKRIRARKCEGRPDEEG